MNWTKFHTYDDDPAKAFEALCNQLFENWCKQEYADTLLSFSVVNGAGGDGGVESYATLKSGDIIGVQAKWFPSCIEAGQICQIRNSIRTAMENRPQIAKYIVCIPRDLASVTGKTKQNNTESNRWESMEQAIHEEFPALSIDLWNETRILAELQKPSSAGIYKFWFERSEISDESVSQSFFRSKDGWLSGRYITDLNTFGKIDAYISAFVGNKSKRLSLKKTFNNISSLCEAFRGKLDELLSICKIQDPKLGALLSETGSKLSKMQNEASKALLWLNDETPWDVSLDESAFYVDLNATVNQIKDSSIIHSYYFYFSEVSEILRKLMQINMRDILHEFEISIQKDSFVFLGKPGTGKTQGFAAEMERLLTEGYHIPILVRARDIPSHYSWRDIIITCLGCSNSWSDDEIWQALCALANRKKIHVLDSAEKILILPKVLVMVDGVDESLPHHKWIDRIQEARALTRNYPQLRFCFSSRPYVFRTNALTGAKFFQIGNSGDVPVSMLFESYMKAYDIKAENVSWLKYALTTPLALKLFCDINRGKIVEYHSRADVSINALIQQKINLLEAEFCVRTSSVSECDQYILRAIQMLAPAFTTNARLERLELIESLAHYLLIDRDRAKLLLQFLEDYGVISRVSESSKEYLAVERHYYIPGIQGYFDYASALLLLDKYQHPREINFEKCKYIEENALYAIATISMQNYNYLITENPTINSAANVWFQEDLLFVALRHTHPSNAGEYQNQLLHSMAQSAEHLIKITNNLILPLSRDTQHPLGCQLLDTFLRQFEKPAQRDVLWSIPPFLLDITRKQKWNSNLELDLTNGEYSLCETDAAEGCPIIYAWALSSVENAKRKKCRDSLMRWALLCPAEFYKLFLQFAFVNDAQIRSDIFSILMCLLFETEDKQLIAQAAAWLMENVLNPQRIEENRDIAIRYYSMEIVRKAVSMNIFLPEDAAQYLPPYQPQKNYIQLDKDALEGTRMEGYSGITYDLARYVLIDHIDTCFSNWRGHTKGQYEKLIEQISAEQSEFAGISSNQLIISAAFAFITACGWTEEFQLYDSSRKAAVGADCAISHAHRPSSHGSQSPVMTICEKYTWQARNYICGYFADRLLYSDDFGAFLVEDYGLLADFIIPSQELNQINPDDIPENHPWHIPEMEKVILEEKFVTKADVINGILHAPNVDWTNWIFVENSEGKYRVRSQHLLALESFSCFYSPFGVETCLWINSILIAKEDLETFISTLMDRSDLAEQIAQPNDWEGGVDSYCYITPKEVCWAPWKKRYNSYFVDEFPHLRIQSAVDKCCYNFLEYGDVYYSLPSLPIREYTGITNSDGYIFCNSKGEIKAEYCIAGEKWETYQQYLLLDQGELLSAVDDNGNILVWIMREYRREDGKSREKFGQFYAEKDCCHIGFIRNGELVVIQILQKNSSNDK